MNIVFTPGEGISITNEYPEGHYRNLDIQRLVDDIEDGSPGLCQLEGAKDALEDGSLWRDDQRELIEHLHHVIVSWEDMQ